MKTCPAAARRPAKSIDTHWFRDIGTALKNKNGTVISVETAENQKITRVPFSSLRPSARRNVSANPAPMPPASAIMNGVIRARSGEGWTTNTQPANAPATAMRWTHVKRSFRNIAAQHSATDTAEGTLGGLLSSWQQLQAGLPDLNQRLRAEKEARQNTVPIPAVQQGNPMMQNTQPNQPVNPLTQNTQPNQPVNPMTQNTQPLQPIRDPQDTRPIPPVQP